MLEVKNLRYWYRPGRDVLKNVSFQVARGEILCLLGPNGTGKTTLLRCLLGLNHQKGGQVLMEGADLSTVSNRCRAKKMAYVPQSTTMAFPYEAREVVLMGRVAHLAPGASHSAKDKQIAIDALERLQMGHLATRKFQELSGGERQMVLVARALAQQADYLIMDEPTANLDYSNQVKILKVIRFLAEQGYGILMTSHYPDHAFLACGKAVLMRDGTVMGEGPADEVITTENLTALYRTPVCVSDAPVEGGSIKVCIPLLEQGCKYKENVS